MLPTTSPFEKICARKTGINRAVLEHVITLAIEIARKGREGRKVGTLFTVCNSEGIDLPHGLGSRHMAAASISKETNAIAVVVSESSLVRVFDHGELVSEIIP